MLHLRYVKSINLKTWEGPEGLWSQTHIIHQADKNQKGEPQIQLAEEALLDLSPLLLVAEASVEGVEVRGPGVLFNAWICLDIAQQSICRCSRRHEQLAESKKWSYENTEGEAGVRRTLARSANFESWTALILSATLPDAGYTPFRLAPSPSNHFPLGPSTTYLHTWERTVPKFGSKLLPDDSDVNYVTDTGNPQQWHHVSSNFASYPCNYIILQTNAPISVIMAMYITDN